MNPANRDLALQRLAELRSSAAALNDAMTSLEASLRDADAPDSLHESMQDSIGPLLDKMQEIHLRMHRITNIRAAPGAPSTIPSSGVLR